MDTNTQTVIRLADLRARVDHVRKGNDPSSLGPAMAELVTEPPDGVDQPSPSSGLKQERDDPMRMHEGATKEVLAEVQG